MRPVTRLQPLRSLRQPSSHSAIRQRLAARSHTRTFHSSRPRHQQNGSGYETVTVSRPAFAWQRVLLFGAYAGGSYFLARYFLRNLWARLGIEEGDLEALAEEEDDEDENIFIAVSFPQKLSQTFYKASDPEWEEFANISRNEEKKQTLREELAHKVAEDLANNPRTAMRLGDDIHISKFWLELKFPDSPPPEYARKGIEIAPEYIAYATQVMPQTEYNQLHRIMLPVVVGTAAINSMRIFSRLQYVRLKTAFGWTLTPMDKQVQALSQIEELKAKVASQKAQVEGIGQGDSPKEGFKRQVGATEQGPESSRQITKTPSTSSAMTASPVGIPTVPSAESMLPSTHLPSDLRIAVRMFMTTLVHQWLTKSIEAEVRGSFLVIGQVEVAGDRGRIKCDVKASYDPKVAKYLYVKTTVKHFWELQQWAKGGP